MSEQPRPETIYEQYVKAKGFAPQNGTHLSKWAQWNGYSIKFMDARRIVEQNKRSKSAQILYVPIKPFAKPFAKPLVRLPDVDAAFVPKTTTNDTGNNNNDNSSGNINDKQQNGNDQSRVNKNKSDQSGDKTQPKNIKSLFLNYLASKQSIQDFSNFLGNDNNNNNNKFEEKEICDLFDHVCQLLRKENSKEFENVKLLKRFVCKYNCGAKLKSEIDKLDHEENICFLRKRNELIRCSNINCTAVFAYNRQDLLIEHERDECVFRTKNRTYRCQYNCGIIMKDKSNIMEHQNNACPNRLIKCALCNETITHCTLSVHWKDKCKGYELDCEICGKTVKGRTALDNHRFLNHNKTISKNNDSILNAENEYQDYDDYNDDYNDDCNENDNDNNDDENDGYDDDYGEDDQNEDDQSAPGYQDFHHNQQTNQESL